MIDEKVLIDYLNEAIARTNFTPRKVVYEEVLMLVENIERLDKWIPFSEKKPEEGQNVYFSLNTGYVEEGMYTKQYGFNLREGFVLSNGRFMNIRDTNAWMPEMKLKPYVEE